MGGLRSIGSHKAYPIPPSVFIIVIIIVQVFSLIFPGDLRTSGRGTRPADFIEDEEAPGLDDSKRRSWFAFPLAGGARAGME